MEKTGPKGVGWQGAALGRWAQGGLRAGAQTTVRLIPGMQIGGLESWREVPKARGQCLSQGWSCSLLNCGLMPFRWWGWPGSPHSRERRTWVPMASGVISAVALQEASPPGSSSPAGCWSPGWGLPGSWENCPDSLPESQGPVAVLAAGLVVATHCRGTEGSWVS